MKITITIESQEDPWYAPYSSPEAYWRYHQKRKDKQEEIDWRKAFRDHQGSHPQFKNEFLGAVNRNHFPNQ